MIGLGRETVLNGFHVVSNTNLTALKRGANETTASGRARSTLSLPTHKRSQRFQVLQISARIIVRSLEDERSVRQFRMPRKAAQSCAPDMTFTDVPVPIDARVVRRA